METFSSTYPSEPLSWPADKPWALAGVVGSGNLEVLLEPNPSAPHEANFSVATPIPGYRESWLAALQDFAAHYPLGGCKATLHDQGAPPIVVKLRLRQALDLLHSK